MPLEPRRLAHRHRVRSRSPQGVESPRTDRSPAPLFEPYGQALPIIRGERDPASRDVGQQQVSLLHNRAGHPGYVERVFAAIVSARTAASSATPRKVADLRLRWKWTPMKCSRGTIVLEPSCWIGKPISSNAAGNSTQLV